MDPLEAAMQGIFGQTAGAGPMPAPGAPITFPRPTLTPPPGINNPLGAAMLLGRHLFATPPAKPQTPSPIGEQAFEAPPPTPAPTPSLGQSITSAGRGASSREEGDLTTPQRSSFAPTSSGAQTAPPSQQSGSLLDPLTAKFLLQTGLSMMVPKWGGPLSNIAQSVGEGAEAVGRTQKEEQATQMGQKKLELEQARIDKMGSGRRSGESSRSKRVKEKKPLEAFGENLSPEATLYFQQRLKNLKGEQEITNPDGTTATLSEADQFNSILRDTKLIDARSRASRGMARSDEIPEVKLRQYVGTPQEIEVLNTVASDPVQRAILAQRIENIKRAQAAANANTPKPK